VRWWWSLGSSTTFNKCEKRHGAVQNLLGSKLWKSETNRLTLLNSICRKLLEASHMSVTAEVVGDTSVGLEQLERDISNTVVPHRRPRPVELRPEPLAPMPDYVEHRKGVNEVGKLSAEAVVREYDAAVKEIEALGAELSEAARRCEAMVAGVHAMVADIKEIAARYRDEGKRYFLQIEAVSLMTSEVRETCEALKKKIATDTLTA
jgi:hypothetical protein